MSFLRYLLSVMAALFTLVYFLWLPEYSLGLGQGWVTIQQGSFCLHPLRTSRVGESSLIVASQCENGGLYTWQKIGNASEFRIKHVGTALCIFVEGTELRLHSCGKGQAVFSRTISPLDPSGLFLHVKTDPLRSCVKRNMATAPKNNFYPVSVTPTCVQSPDYRWQILPSPAGGTSGGG